jgi:UDPglucose 6-dehydrogenase
MSLKSTTDKKVYNERLNPTFVFDGRNVVDKDKLSRIGFEIYNIGKGSLE